MFSLSMTAQPIRRNNGRAKPAPKLLFTLKTKAKAKQLRPDSPTGLALRIRRAGDKIDKSRGWSFWIPMVNIFPKRSIDFCKRQPCDTTHVFHWQPHGRCCPHAVGAAHREPLYEQSDQPRLRTKNSGHAIRLPHADRQLIPDMLGGGHRFDYDTEALIIASRKGYRIESVPITTVYTDQVSKIHPVRDSIRFFKMMRRYRKHTRN